MTRNSMKKEIIDTLNKMSGRYTLNELFFDACKLMAITLRNTSSILHDETWEKLEKDYINTITRYDKDTQRKFPELLARIVELFERESFIDHIGQIYMELFGGNKNLGQCFTPQSIADIIGDVTLKDRLKETNPEELPIKISDPACGGGALLLGAMRTLHEDGFNYQQKAIFYATDLDPLCCYICYIQCSLSGARAYITNGDSLSQKEYWTWATPMEKLYPAILLR